jgi:hypothetical protein
MVCDYDLKTGLHAWVDEKTQIYNSYSKWDVNVLKPDKS